MIAIAPSRSYDSLMESRFKKQGRCCVLLSRKYADALEKLSSTRDVTKVSIVERALDDFFDNLVEPL